MLRVLRSGRSASTILATALVCLGSDTSFPEYIPNGCVVGCNYAAAAGPVTEYWVDDAAERLRPKGDAGPPAMVESPGLTLDANSNCPGTNDLTPCPGTCDNPACPTCRMCPHVDLYAESLFLTRGNGNVAQPIILDGLSRQTLLATSDLGFGWNPGLRVGGGIRLHDCLYLEFSYLGLFDSQALAPVVRSDSAPFPTLPGDLGPATNVFHPADKVWVNYASQLNSFELNLLRCCCGCWTAGCDASSPCRSVEWFGGFRCISLNERLKILGEREHVLEPGVERGEYDLRTTNNLYGAQLGARLRRCHGRLGCEATGKAGMYGNAAYQEQSVVDFPNYALRPNTSATRSQVAFAGELNLSAIYQLTIDWNLRAGYNLMWIEGVALAPNQLDFSFTPTSGSQLDSGGGVFYHGVNVGLEARW
ncbi:MAG: BBP7 family outer membrane beta-barrel protein [Planctomycetota bacterium]|nr:BBP7 family outer membrane beta-barrel protein [Planctomycetota bacterium]